MKQNRAGKFVSDAKGRAAAAAEKARGKASQSRPSSAAQLTQRGAPASSVRADGGSLRKGGAFRRGGSQMAVANYADMDQEEAGEVEELPQVRMPHISPSTALCVGICSRIEPTQPVRSA